MKIRTVDSAVLCALLLTAFAACNIRGAGNTTLASRSDLRLNGFPPSLVDTRGPAFPKGYLAHLRLGQTVSLKLEGSGLGEVTGVTAKVSPPVALVQGLTLYDYEITAVAPGEGVPSCHAAFMDGSMVEIPMASPVIIGGTTGYDSVGRIRVED